MIEWLEDIGYGTITGRFGGITGDGPDANRVPDTHSKKSGVVTFRPSASFVRYTGTGGNIMLSLDPFEAIIDNEGYLCTKMESGLPGERGVVLPASDSSAISPRNFTYSVTINIEGTNYSNFNIRINSGETLDLSTAVPVQSSVGSPVIVDNSSALLAAGHAENARGYSESALESMNTAINSVNQASVYADESNNSSIQASNYAVSAGESAEQAELFAGSAENYRNEIANAFQTIGSLVVSNYPNGVFGVLATNPSTSRFIYFDTGWRNVSHLLSSSFVADPNFDAVLMRRTIDTVYFRIVAQPSASIVGTSAETLTRIVEGVPSTFTEDPASYAPFGYNQHLQLSNSESPSIINIRAAGGVSYQWGPRFFIKGQYSANPLVVPTGALPGTPSIT